MPRKIENIADYITAHDAAQLLSLKHHRPIRTDYISKMAKSRRHCIRTARFRDRLMYHREDIQACTLRQKTDNTAAHQVKLSSVRLQNVCS